MRPPYLSVRGVNNQHSAIQPSAAKSLTVQVIPQPLMRPVGVAAFLLNGLSLLSVGASAAAEAADGDANEQGRRKWDEDAECVGEVGAGHFVCVVCGL